MKHLSAFLLLAMSISSCRTTDESGKVSAEGPKEVKLVLDKEFTGRWTSEIIPFVENGNKGYFSGTRGAQLEYVNIDRPNAKANVIIVHGYSQNFRSFSEVMYNMWDNGYAVHGYSQVGHGCSDHILLSEEQNAANRASQCHGLSTKRNGKTYYSNPDYCKVHVDDKNRYFSDLKIFVDRVKTPNRKTYLYCHSMGGGICSRFIQDYPDAVDAVFLNSPMHAAKSGPFPGWFSNIILEGTSKMRPEGYLPTSKEIAIEDMQFEKGADHTSKVRFEAEKALAGVEQGRFRCGATFSQANELLDIGIDVIKKENLKLVKVPVVIAAGGAKLDRWVELGAMEKFCKGVESCRYRVHENARHEIYNEPDAIRIPMMKDVLSFYDNPLEFIRMRDKRYYR